MKFEVGDRVMAIGNVAGVNLSRKVGTVVHIDNHGLYNIGVEFDESFEHGHYCKGYGKYGYCRYGKEDEFVIIEDSLPIDVDELFV